MVYIIHLNQITFITKMPYFFVLLVAPLPAALRAAFGRLLEFQDLPDTLLVAVEKE